MNARGSLEHVRGVSTLFIEPSMSLRLDIAVIASCLGILVCSFFYGFVVQMAPPFALRVRIWAGVIEVALIQPRDQNHRSGFETGFSLVEGPNLIHSRSLIVTKQQPGGWILSLPMFGLLSFFVLVTVIHHALGRSSRPGQPWTR